VDEEGEWRGVEEISNLERFVGVRGDICLIPMWFVASAFSSTTIESSS